MWPVPLETWNAAPSPWILFLTRLECGDGDAMAVSSISRKTVHRNMDLDPCIRLAVGGQVLVKIMECGCTGAADTPSTVPRLPRHTLLPIAPVHWHQQASTTFCKDLPSVISAYAG